MSFYELVHETGVPGTNQDVGDDDWDTDPDYVNDVSEKEQRTGSKLIQPMKAEMLSGDTPTLQALAQKAKAQQDAVSLEEWQSKKTLYGGDREEN